MICVLWNCRKELVWPELDRLLRDEDDVAVSTPYTAAIPEYRIVFHDSADVAQQDKSWANANGHAVFDAQHPCRYNMCIILDSDDPISCLGVWCILFCTI